MAHQLIRVIGSNRVYSGFLWNIRLVSMVETEFGLLEVQRENPRRDAIKLGQTKFGKGPEGLDPIDIAVALHKILLTHY